ncbi:hypothetical protein OsI_24806 [Oryza sativa Indica Group]|jgi:hypothetical protein|uniref:Uncharacterized protein n=5 Tax=Oryza TaxID=4527 RepID=A3BGC7_ORYSJ|nr:hypothetical protein OsI_24806 [Oryza sativa Indica Group]EAZ38616.1 hypothetical protein OsJ_23006 [Oryza sativa Japonica Group]
MALSLLALPLAPPHCLCFTVLRVARRPTFCRAERINGGDHDEELDGVPNLSRPPPDRMDGQICVLLPRAAAAMAGDDDEDLDFEARHAAAGLSIRVFRGGEYRGHGPFPWRGG